MQERTLLVIALILGCIGIIVLGLLPELPEKEIVGRVAWSNGTDARLVTESELWVHFETPVKVTEGMCVHLQGSQSNNRVDATRLVRVRSPTHHPCQTPQE